MAKEDAHVTENIDRDINKVSTDLSTEKANEEGPKKDSLEKNAHASGTGAMGRNESSLPEEEDQKPPQQSIY